MDHHDEKTCARRTSKIRELNDQLRKVAVGGKIYLTQAVAGKPPELTIALLRAVREFEAFTPDNDPYGEHDFGSVTVDGEAFFWKIDCYDLNLEFGSPDPSDEAVTRRILTIMTVGDL